MDLQLDFGFQAVIAKTRLKQSALIKAKTIDVDIFLK